MTQGFPFENVIKDISRKNDIIQIAHLVRDGSLDNINISRALIIASAMGSLPVVCKLIELGADVNYQSSLGTSLTEGVYEGHIDIVKALLKAGADTSIPEYGEISHPLAVAAYRGSLEMVRLIVESGAYVNQVHKGTGESAIWAAAAAGCEEIFNYLSVLSDRTLRDEAAQILPCGIWERKIKEAADPKVIELTSAIMNDDTEKALKIIAEGTDVNGVDDVGSTPLLLASSYDNYPVMEALLLAGADPNFVLESEECKDFNDGTTNLMRVSRKETCLLLLNYGADVNAKNNQGETALTIAVKGSNVEMVKVLLQRGADISLSNNQNETPLDLAKSNKDKVMISLLEYWIN
jgi:ankyrin repeat protein